MGKRVGQMVINITDVCNMVCDFCLRGDGCGRTLDLSLIPKIFEGIDAVDCITITGGDPSCYPEGVTAIVDWLEEHKNTIRVEGLYIVTNGKVYCQELVDAVKRMMFIHLEDDFGNRTISGCNQAKSVASWLEELSYNFAVSVSMDEYHEPISMMNYLKYHTSGVYSAVKEHSFAKGGVIGRGRGANIPGSHYKTYLDFYVELEGDDIFAENVYVTVEGKVYADCDMSYEMEEYDEPVGDLEEESLAEIMQQYADDNMDSEE